MNDEPPRLTSFAHGGGCGCKLSPAVLASLMAGLPPQPRFPGLLVGTETRDDAAVFRIDDERALVATTDFFMPIVDDPFDFGRIAAANALSDVYAMGARPLMAQAILGMPLGRIEPTTVQAILAGGAHVCGEAGIPVAGGHSIDSAELIYGLAVQGVVHPDRVLRNAGAQAGDVLILGKPLGVGILSAALKGGRLDPARSAAAYAELVASTTRLNAAGARLGEIAGVHAVTDVTGFGLLGHALEMSQGSGRALTIALADVPLLAGVAALAQAPYRTGASGRNWASYGPWITLAPGLAEWQRDLLTDPQTSGGLLVAVSPDQADRVLAAFAASGLVGAAVIGRVGEGPPGIAVV